MWDVKGPRPARREHVASEAQLAELLAAAVRDGLAVIPRGGGTQDGWGGPLRRADVHLDMTALAGVLAYEPADLTVTVRAGTPLSELQSVLAAHGQWLPLDPPFPDRATVGGVIAGGAYGPWRQLHGGPRDLVIGLRVALAGGDLIRTGARVVKNVAGFDLGKAFIGSFGTLGVLTECSLKVRPLPGERRTLRARCATAAAAWRLSTAVLGSELVPAALALRGGELLVAFEEAADYQERRLRELCGALPAGAEAAPGGEDVWEAVRTFPCGRSCAVRANVPVAAVGHTIGVFEEAGFETLAYPGLGTVWGAAASGAVESGAVEARAALAVAMAGAGAAGGHAVAVSCPPSFDPWGAPGGLAPLCRALKERLDPTGVLSPGRLGGGV